jgi:PPOX class probable F420-dependent enzyme
MATRTGRGLPSGTDRDRIASAPVGRLATIRPDGTPHVVPVTFALSDNTVVTAVDSKPKRTTDLQRLRNLRADPHAALLVDRYSDDWSDLWWLRVDGTVAVVPADDARQAIHALAAKYAQYRSAPPGGPVLVLTPVRWTVWTAADG